ncbi:MAG: hypothetical protein CSA72_08390 [Rhodobacterales bacterium]|nr:MAG: hypothetical protein CSA72_08390 [Rhodobacterales bacterium]
MLGQFKISRVKLCHECGERATYRIPVSDGAGMMTPLNLCQFHAEALAAGMLAWDELSQKMESAGASL